LSRENINYDVFSKIVGQSCITKEIREVIFGVNVENVVEPGYVRPSIFAYDPNIKLQFDSSYFNDPQVWGQGNEGIIVNDGSSG
jgi:hypothetical protein